MPSATTPSAASQPAAVPPGGLTFPWAAAPAPGKVTEVAPGVCWLRMPLPFALNHINLWLLRDGADWTVVDCGFGSDETRALWERLFAEVIRPGRVRRVLLTHFHPDHFGLAAWLAERWQAPVHLAEAEFAAARGWHESAPLHTREAHLEMFRAHGLDLGEAAVKFAKGNLYKRGVPSIPERVEALSDGDRFTIGGRTWRALAGHGHSPEHISYFCDELRLLIAGDMVLPRISTNVSVQPREPDGNPLEAFLQSLRRHAELPPDTLVLPSHGLPFRGLRTRLAQLAAHHAERLAELVEACGEPTPASELMKVIFRRPLDVHQTFFAMGETLSHLNKLVHDGALARVRVDGGFRFVAAPGAARRNEIRAGQEEIAR
jgi:glyoxylase-like metal-dependent hydrolase (beta-lactamase superfamily II)